MDQYSVLKTIGEGSFGRALLVQHRDKEQYVMKEIRLPKAECRMKNVRREAVLLSRMKHSSIVTFIDSFEEDGHLYIVMEFCNGGDLLHRIQLQKGSLFSEHVILSWFAQMCLGTEHIHKQRVLHRDLKAKNIFLTNHGTVKLGDFGSACSLNSAKAFAQTYVGTPYYVSPEIWDNQPYNNKSDVWSLGCVLYELCALHHPFHARSWKSLILKVCRGAYPPLPRHLSYELHYLIKHMFKANPKDRPSVHTILNSHRVSKLLHKHLKEKGNCSQQREETTERPVNHWRKEDGHKVAQFLGQQSLLTSSATDDMFYRKSSRSEKVEPRKMWAEGTSTTVLQVLRNADLISSGGGEGFDSTSGSVELYVDVQKRRERKKWDRDPPERLLKLLENAPLSSGFQTYTIDRAEADELRDPVVAVPSEDTPDGPEEIPIDRSRLESRSDDDDTDFEDDCNYNWVDELEEMMKNP